MLSIVTGILSAGVTFGPTIGGFIIHTSNQVLLVFYGAVIMFLCFVVFVLTLLPESLPHEQMVANQIKYDASGRIWTTFLAPLSLFLPTRIETVPGSHDQPGTDWNLTWIGIVYGIVTMILVSRPGAAAHHRWSK